MRNRPVLSGSGLDPLLHPKAPLPSQLLACLTPLLPEGQAPAACWTFLLGLLELRLTAAGGRVALEALARGSLDALHSRWTWLAAQFPGQIVPSDLAGIKPLLSELAGLALTCSPPVLTLEAPDDWLAPYFQGWIGAKAARRQGEHMTSPLLARYLLEGLGWPQVYEQSGPSAGASSLQPRLLPCLLPCLLDPACGTGTFLVQALALALRKGHSSAHDWLSRLEGWDIQPYAVLATRIQLAWFVVQHTQQGEGVCTSLETLGVTGPRVFLRDALEQTLPAEARFTCVVGNPPWVGWETLSRAERDRLTLAFKQEGLWLRSSTHLRYGAGKKDLSMLFLARALSEWLAPGGRLSFVLPRSLLTGRPAEGLRLRLESGPWGVERVDVFAQAGLFSATAVPACALTLGKVEPGAARAAIPWEVWRNLAQAPAGQRTSAVLSLPAQPSGQPWVPRTRAPEGASEVPSEVPSMLELDPWPWAPRAAGSKPRAWEGANTGGANGIFWIDILEVDDVGRLLIQNRPERGRRPVVQQRGWVEPDRVFPLLRGREVRAGIIRPEGWILLMQDPVRREGLALEALQALPLTRAWLEPFQSVLEARPLYQKFFRAQGAPWYSIYNVGEYTLAPWKVVWREQARELTAAAVGPLKTCGELPEAWIRLGLIARLGEKPLIPDHKLMLVPCDGEQEAIALATWLNSAPVRRVAGALVQGTSAPVRLLDALLAQAGASPFCPED